MKYAYTYMLKGKWHNALKENIFHKIQCIYWISFYCVTLDFPKETFEQSKLAISSEMPWLPLYQQERQQQQQPVLHVTGQQQAAPPPPWMNELSVVPEGNEVSDWHGSTLSTGGSRNYQCLWYDGDLCFFFK